MQATMEYLGINQFLQIPFYVNLHTHSTYELLYYYRGEGSLHCGSSLFAYTSGSVVVIPPSVTHDEIHRTATNVAYIHFSIDDDSLFPQPSIYSDMKEKVEGMVQDLSAEWTLDSAYHEEKQNATLLLLLIELLRTQNAHKIGGISGYFAAIRSRDSDVRHFMLEEQEISSLGYSRDRYRHIFKEKTGIAPHQFIIQTRIEKAKYLLTYTSLTITEIAALCGYSSSAYFAMQFKKRLGVTPSDYRGTR